MPDATDQELAEQAIAALWLAERRVAQLGNWRGSRSTERRIGRLRRNLNKAYRLGPNNG